MINAKMLGGDGNLYEEVFLVDSGADRTVLSAAFASRLQLQPTVAPGGYVLQGIGGSSGYTVFVSTLEFIRTDNQTTRVRGQYHAFLDPKATDCSILGRDVLDNFDVILSRQRQEVLLLAGNHQYQIVGP
jgi:hypothetical protein